MAGYLITETTHEERSVVKSLEKTLKSIVMVV